MGYQIQRLSFGGVFDQAFRLMKENFLLLSAGFAALYVPMNLVQSLLSTEDPTALSGTRLAFSGILVLLAVAFGPLFQLAATIVIADAYLSRPTTFGVALSRAFSIFFPYLGTTLLFGLALIPLTLLFIVPGLYFAVAWMLIGPIGVVEGLFGTRAMKRSRDLVRGHWWRTFGTMTIGTIGSTIASMGFAMLFAFIPIVSAIFSGAVQAVFATYGTALLIVLYLDLRCRREDYDLQLLANDVAGDHSGKPPAQMGQGPQATAP